MKQKQRKRPFKKCETGYHKFAVHQLSEWVQGEVEKPFYVNDMITFVPDVVCYNNGIIDKIYEVVFKHPITGKKLGFIFDWCYRNGTEVSLFEVSADYILSQTVKPERIETMEYYDINPFNN